MTKEEEIAQLKTEVERSEWVTKAKASHGEIEKLERQRKVPAVMSLLLRIGILDENIQELHSYVLAFDTKTPNSNTLQAGLESVNNKIKLIVQTYGSIRLDFSKSICNNVTELDSILPQVEAGQSVGRISDIISIETYLSQAMAYLVRFMA
jgi:hypothetical protein